MNLTQLEASLSQAVNDSKLAEGFVQNLNDTILELAADFELPALRLADPVSLTVDNSKWLWPMPGSFHKKLLLVKNAGTTPWSNVRICRIEELNSRDPEHDDTGDHVSDVAEVMQGEKWYLGIYPLPTASEDLKLWFYRKPAVLSQPNDVPDCIPPEYHYRVIVVKTVLRNFRLFIDAIEDGPMKSVAHWEELYRRGLYGEPRGDIGMVNYLSKLRGGPKRHGGRDPIGPGRMFRGYR